MFRKNGLRIPCNGNAYKVSPRYPLSYSQVYAIDGAHGVVCEDEVGKAGEPADVIG